jgi:hypothetical protein
LSIINANSTDTLKAFGWIWGAVVVLIILFEEVKAVHPLQIYNQPNKKRDEFKNYLNK